MDARIAPPFMEATDASRLVCVVVVSYQEYSLTHKPSLLIEKGERGPTLERVVAARIGDRLRREIGRGRRPRVGDG